MTNLKLGFGIFSSLLPSSFLYLILVLVVVSDPHPYPQVVSNYIFCEPSEPIQQIVTEYK